MKVPRPLKKSFAILLSLAILPWQAPAQALAQEHEHAAAENSEQNENPAPQPVATELAAVPLPTLPVKPPPPPPPLLPAVPKELTEALNKLQDQRKRLDKVQVLLPRFVDTMGFLDPATGKLKHPESGELMDPAAVVKEIDEAAKEIVREALKPKPGETRDPSAPAPVLPAGEARNFLLELSSRTLVLGPLAQIKSGHAQLYRQIPGFEKEGREAAKATSLAPDVDKRSEAFLTEWKRLRVLVDAERARGPGAWGLPEPPADVRAFQAEQALAFVAESDKLAGRYKAARELILASPARETGKVTEALMAKLVEQVPPDRQPALVRELGGMRGKLAGHLAGENQDINGLLADLGKAYDNAGLSQGDLTKAMPVLQGEAVKERDRLSSSAATVPIGGISPTGPQLTLSDPRQWKVGGSVPALTLGDPNAPKPEQAPPPPPWWTQGLPAWEAALGMVRPLDGSDPFKLAAAMAKRSLLLPVPPTEEEKIAERLGELARAAGRRELELKYQADRESIRNGIKALQGKLSSPTAAGLPQTEELDTLAKAIEDFKVHGFVSFLDGTAATPKSGKKKAAPATGAVAEHERLVAEFKADAGRVGVDAKAVREKSQAEAAKLAKPLKALSGQIEALDRGDQGGTAAAKAGLLPVRLKNFSERLAAPAAAAEAARLNLLEEDRVLLDAELIKARKGLEALAVNGMASSYVHISDTILRTLKSAPNKFLSMEGKSKDQVDAHQAAVKEFMSKTWPALLKDMPALWDLLEPVWAGSAEGVRKDCAGQRAQAEKLLGLIKSMKESNFNPTLLDKDTLGLVLGDAEKGGDLGFMGQAMLKNLETKRLNSEKLTGLLGALKGIEGLKLDGSDSDSELLARFFENPANKKLMEGTDLEAVVAQWTAAKQAEASGAPAAPGKPGAKEAYRNLIESLTFAQAQEEKPSEERTRAMLYLRHAQLNRSVYEYLTGPSASAADKAAYAEFMAEYEKDKDLKKEPTRADLDRQGALTDKARNLLRNFPEYKAMVRSQQANAQLQGELEGLLETGDAGTRAALAKAGAPDLANLSQRAEKQTVLQWGIMAYQQGIVGRDSQAWEGMKDQMLAYYYGPDFKKATQAQSEALRGGTDDALRAFESGNFNPSALAGTFDGIVTPTISVFNPQTQKKEPQTFITSGFLKEIPRLQARDKEGRLTGRDQMLMAVWQGDGDSRSESFKGSLKGMLVAAADTNKKLAGLARATGPDQLPGADDPSLKTFLLYLGEGASREKLAEILRKPRDDPDAASIFKYLDGLAAQFESNASIIQKGVSNPEDADALAEAFRAAGLDVYDERLLKIAANPGGVSQEPADEEGRRNLAALRQLKRQPGLAENADGKAMFSALMADLKNNKAPAQAQARSDQLLFTTNDETQAAYGKLAGVLGNNAAFSQLSGLLNALNEQKAANDDLMVMSQVNARTADGRLRQRLAGDLSLLMTQSHLSLRDGHAEDGLSVSGWLVGRGDDEKVVRRNKFSGEEADRIDPKSRRSTNNDVADVSVGLPPGTAKDGIQTVKLDSKGRPTGDYEFTSLDGSYRRSVANLPAGGAPGQEGRFVSYRDKDGGTVYREVDETGAPKKGSKFFRVLDPALPPAPIDGAKEGDFRRVRELKVTTLEGGQPTVHSMTFYAAAAGDQVLKSGPNEKGQVTRRAAVPGENVVLSLTRSGGGQIVQIDYESGTQFIRRGDVGWQFSLSEDYGGLNKGKSRTFMTFEDGKAVAQYSEYLEVNPETKTTALKRTVLNDPKNKIGGATITGTYTVATGFNADDVKARFQAESKTGAGVAMDTAGKLAESVSVKFDHKGGKIGDQAYADVARRVRTMLGENPGSDFNGDLAGLMQLFDGQVKRPGDIKGADVFDVGFNFGAGGTASVSTRQWDKAANRVINDKPLNFRYTELPKENAELFSGPDTVQGREQKLQVSNTNRLKAIRDFLGDKSHAFVLYETDENLGIPEFANGKRRNRERVSSFVGRQNWSGAQRQYRVGEVDKDGNWGDKTYEKGGAGLLWGSDVMQGVAIADMNGNIVKRSDFKVGTGTSLWNAAAKLGDYTSNSIRYNDWGENNPMAAAILGGLAGGLIEGLLDPTNLLMMGGMAAAAKIAIKSAKAIDTAVKTGKTVSRTTKVIKQTSEFTVKTLPKAFKGLMYYQGGMAGYNLSVGAATGNLDMINQGVRGAAMLIPMDGIYHWMGKQSKSVFGGNKPPPDIPNKNLPGDAPAPPKDAPKPPPDGDPTPPPPHHDPPAPGKNPPNADPPPPGNTPPPHVDPPAPNGPPPPRVDPPAPPGNPPHGLPAPVPHSPLPTGIHASKPAGFDSGTLGSPSASAIGGDISPRSGMVANKGTGPAVHSAAPGTAKAPEPIKAPEAAPKAPEAAPKTAPPAPKPADPIAVKEAPAHADAAAQRVEGGSPSKAPAEPPKDLLAMGPRPEVTPAPHQAAPHQPKADLDANLGRGPPKKGGDFDSIHGDADGKFKTPEPKEGGLKELKKAREQGFSDRTPVEPKQPKASQLRQTNTGEPRQQPSSKPAEPNPKPADPGTPAKDPAPAPKEPDLRPTDAPKPVEPAVSPQEPSVRPQDAAPQGDPAARPQEAGTGPKTTPDKPGFFDKLNDRMATVEGFLAKTFPTFAAAGRTGGRKLSTDWNQTVLRHHQRVANFQANNPRVTAFIKGANAVAQAPGNMLAGWGRKLNSVADGLVKPKAPGAAPDAPPELNAFGKFARAMGNRLQGAGLEGRTALDWTEARYSKVQDRPDFIKAAKAADLAGGEGVLHARTDPSTGRIVEISAKPFAPKDGSVDLELKVLKDGDGFELAGLAVSPGSRGKLAPVAAEHLDYLMTESFKSPLTAKHAETLLGDPGLQAKIVAAMDPATRASEVELHWDKAKKQWSVEPIPGDPAAPKARMQLTKDLGSDTFRLTGFSGKGAPPAAAANLQAGLMSGLANGLDLAGVKAASPAGADQALALKGAAPAAAETPAMRDNRARMGKAVDQSFELLGKFGPEGADADGFVKGLQRSDPLPEAMAARKEAIAKMAQEYLGIKEPLKVTAPDTDPLSGAQIFILKKGDEVVGVYKVFTNNGKGPVTIMNELGAGRTLGSLGLKKSIPVDSLGAWRLGESGEIGYMMAGASGKDFYGYFKEIGKLEVGSPARAEKVAEIQGRVESMAKAMAEMHQAGPTGKMDPGEKKASLDKALVALDAMKGKLPAETYRAMRERLTKLGEGYMSHDIPGHITHGDAHPGNFFMDKDGKITMIDLETSMESISKSGKGTKSPLGDVGRFVESMALNNKLKGMNLTPSELSGLQQAFLKSYAKEAKIQPADFEAHRQYHQARMQVIALKYAKTPEDFNGLLDAVKADLSALPKPSIVETLAMHENRLKMGKAVDQSFELLGKFGPEGADADGFVKGLQRSDPLPEAMAARKEAIAKMAQEYLGIKEPLKVTAPDTDPLSGAQIFILKKGDEVVGVYKVFTNNGKGPVTIMNELGAGRTLGSLGLKKSIPVDSLGAWRLGESGEIGYMMAGASGKDFYGYFKEIGKLEVGSPARAEKVAEIQGKVEAMAHAMAEMHDAGPKGTMEAAEKKSSVEKALAGLDQMKSKLSPETYQAMRSRLEKLGEGYLSHDIPGHITHGDAHPGNFFMDKDGKITMIDLETSMESISKSGKGTKSPLGDVGRFVESMALNNKLKGMNLTPEELSGLQQAFLAAYAKQAKIKPVDFEAHRQYHQARMQVTALKYAKTQEDFDGLLAAVKMDLAKATGGDAPWMKGAPEASRPFLEERVYRDVLTGAYNQRYLDDHGAALIRDYQEAVMFDGDSFGSIDRSMRKLFGDTVGGLMADEVLARMIRRAEEGAAAAGKSVVVRKGGEEVVIFAKKGEGAKIAEAARHAGERFHADDLELAEVLAQFGRTHGVKGDVPTIMEAVRQQAVVDAKAKATGAGQPESSINLEQVRSRVGTLSLGVARIDPSGAPDAALERAIKLADRALDHSKKAGGKNSVSEVADDGSFRLREHSAQGSRPPRIERAPVWETPEYQQSLKALGQTELESFLSAIHTDPKTGLGNRESIRENLAERLGAFDRLYKVEIDNFKAVNDHAELGHDAGDVMFKEFGKVVLEVRAEIAKEMGIPESQVLHAARVVSKDFHVLAKDRTGERFAELLPKRLAEGDRLLAAVAAHKFGAGDPAFQPTAKQVEQVRSWVAEQAKATGKDPARVGTATGHLVRVEVPAHGDKGAAYDRAVQDATTVIETQKAWRNAAARPELGPGELAARVPVDRYIPFETFKKLHPSLEAGEVYHNYLHSMKVADMAFALASKRLPGDQAALVAEIAMLHDLDPLREPGKAARVPATIELLRADFEGKMSIHGEKGRSVLKEVFGWDARKLAIAEAMIQRTEFPFDATHKNPAYAGAGNSPPERYEAMLRKLSPADQKFVLEEAAMLSEFADKSSWYATEKFEGAAKIVDALAGEINAGIGKPVMDFSKLDTAGFLSTIGTEGAYAFDRAMAAKLGLPELGLLSRSQAWALLPGHGRVFESNLKGFEEAKAALAKGESIDAAKARGAASAEAKLKEPAVGAGDQPSVQAARTALEAMDPSGVRGLASKAAAELLGLPGVTGGTMRDLEPKSLKALENLAADLSVRILGDPAAPAGRSAPAANADVYRPDWTADNQKAFASALEKSFGSLAKDGTQGFDRKAVAAAAEVVDALPAKVDRTGSAEAKAAADAARGEASARLVQEYLGLAERPGAVLPETLPTSGADVFLMRAGGKTVGVYKVYPKAHAEQMLADELAAGKILEGFGLKRSGLVRPLGTFRHGDSGELGLLMEAAPGKDLFTELRGVGRFEPGSAARGEALGGAEEQVRAVAASMAELHQAGKGTSISTKARRETLLKTLEYVDALASPAGNGNFADSSIPADVAEALKAKLKLIGKDYVRGKSPGAVVHGDSHPGNFMIQDGKVVIIDAESLLKSVGPGLKGTESPMADVARFLESLPTNNKIKGINLEPGEIARVQKAFLDAYAEAGGLSPEAFQAQIAFFRAKFQVTALRYAANRAELDMVLDAIRTDLQAGGTGLRSPPKGKAALDANALIGALDSGELAAVDRALGGRSPVISIGAAKEYLKKGDVEVLRNFLKARGGKVGAAAGTEQVADLQAQATLLGRVLKAQDAAVAGSAIKENAPLLTRDKKLFNFLKASGVAVEKY